MGKLKNYSFFKERPEFWLRFFVGTRFALGNWLDQPIFYETTRRFSHDQIAMHPVQRIIFFRRLV